MTIEVVDKNGLTILKLDVWTLILQRYFSSRSFPAGIDGLKILVDGIEVERPASFEMEL